MKFPTLSLWCSMVKVTSRPIGFVDRYHYDPAARYQDGAPYVAARPSTSDADGSIHPHGAVPDWALDLHLTREPVMFALDVESGSETRTITITIDDAATACLRGFAMDAFGIEVRRAVEAELCRLGAKKALYVRKKYGEVVVVTFSIRPPKPE